MKTPRALAYPLALLLALAGPARAEDAAAIAHRLVVRSGMAVQLHGVPKSIGEQTAQMRGKAPDALVDALDQAGKEAFRADALQEEIERLLPGRLKPAEMLKAIEWLETDVGRRVTRAEELAAVTMDDAALKRYAQQTGGKPPPAARSKRLQSLISATNAVESSASVIEATALGVAIGMDSMQPVQKRVGPALLRAQLKKAMPPEKVRESLRESLPGLFAYTYREVSDADLAAYDAFLRSPAGKKYNDTMLEVFGQALVSASVRMGQLADPGSRRSI